MYYTGVVFVPCRFLMPFDMPWGALVLFHLGLCVAHIGVVVLVSFLVGILCTHVGPPSEVAQGTHMVLYLGYAPLEVVSLVGGRPWKIFLRVT